MTEDQAERLITAIETQTRTMAELCDHLGTIAHANAVLLNAMAEAGEEAEPQVDPLRTLESAPLAELSQRYDLARAD